MNKDNHLIFEAYTLKGLAAGKTLEDIAKKHSVDADTLGKELDRGIKVEHEHTGNEAAAKKIAFDHLFEDPHYYTKLAKMEDEERRLDPKCWSGYHKQGTKMKDGVRVNNCVKNQDENQKVDNIDAYETKQVEQEETPSSAENLRSIANTLLEISHKMWKGMGMDSFYSAKELELIKSHAESILRRVKNVAEEKSKVTSASHSGYREILKSFK